MRMAPPSVLCFKKIYLIEYYSSADIEECSEVHFILFFRRTDSINIKYREKIYCMYYLFAI